MKEVIHLVGYGSQGRPWARCLRRAGRRVIVYGRDSAKTNGRNGVASAIGEDFEAHDVMALPEKIAQTSGLSILVLSCSDEAIAEVYESVRGVEAPVLGVLLHGFAVYSGALNLATLPAQHAFALLAPKAIGPELEREFFKAHPAPHALKMAVQFPAHAAHAPHSQAARQLALDLGFAPESFIPATFEQETVSDLISEQGLLCGGVFTLLDWTMEQMMRAGVPPALAKEECFKELELIAHLLVEKGFATTFRSISQAAQAGTVAMRERLDESGAKIALEGCVKDILNKRFVEFFTKKSWKNRAASLAAGFQRWDDLNHHE